MTLFTGEGYLHAWAIGHNSGEWAPVKTVGSAYRRWLSTQQDQQPAPHALGLLAEPEMYANRAPGLTSLRALQSDELGSREQPANASKGCGGAERTAPAGFAPTSEMAYSLGCDFAALTHGARGGWAPGGALALITHLVAVRGRGLATAVDQAAGRALRDDTETALALAQAATLAHQGPDLAALESLGQGWIGPEALAIGVYAALTHPKPDMFSDALCFAANHSGHSDTTASITGNLLGARHGTAALPRPWLTALELADVVERIGHDLGASVAQADFEVGRYLQL